MVKELDTYHTEFGTITASAMNKEKAVSSKNEHFMVLDPSFVDIRDNLLKGPQIITAKDIGWILAKTGVNKHSAIVDAGGGAGHLAFALAHVSKEVTVYEINPEHFDLLQKNKELLQLKNVTLRQNNIYDGIKEKELDVITLDLPEPGNVLPHAEKALKLGGFLVAYLPNLTQVQSFITAAKRTSIVVLETIELLERKWKIEDKILRPEFQMLGHTGFLTLCRKM